MEANTAEASYFLPSYDARACASATERLRFSLDAMSRRGVDAATWTATTRAKRRRRRRRGRRGGDAAGVSLVTRRDVNENTNENEENKTEKAEETEPDAIALDALSARVAHGRRRRRVRVQRRRRQLLFSAAATRRKPRRRAPTLILERLSGCVVFVLGAVRALRCHDLRDTKVYGGPVAGSAHLQNLEGCHVEIAARRRVHAASRAFSRTKSRPIIEHSSECDLRTVRVRIRGARARFAAAGLAPRRDAGASFADFGWIAARQSPNWRVALGSPSRRCRRRRRR